MSFFDLADEIQKKVRSISAINKYNKLDVLRITEPAFYKKIFHDITLVKNIIAQTLETNFCKITEIVDCEFTSKTKVCICTKVMVFGEDEINGKICEKFNIRTTARQCNDGNFELTKKCAASSFSGPCTSILIDKDQEIFQLREKLQKCTEENKKMSGELSEIYEIFDYPPT